MSQEEKIPPNNNKAQDEESIRKGVYQGMMDYRKRRVEQKQAATFYLFAFLLTGAFILNFLISNPLNVPKESRQNRWGLSK